MFLEKCSYNNYDKIHITSFYTCILFDYITENQERAYIAASHRGVCYPQCLCCASFICLVYSPYLMPTCRIGVQKLVWNPLVRHPKYTKSGLGKHSVLPKMMFGMRKCTKRLMNQKRHVNHVDMERLQSVRVGRPRNKMVTKKRR